MSAGKQKIVFTLLLGLFWAISGKLSPAWGAPGVGRLPLGSSQAPSLQARPLPSPLSAIDIHPAAGDYLDRIEPTLLGYLLWSRFPIRVFVDPGPDGSGSGTEFDRQKSALWQAAVGDALAEWGAYLPLERAERPEAADILIWQQAPPLKVWRDPETGRVESRARSGEARYEFYSARTPEGTMILAHRMTIYLGAKTSSLYLRATIRHELGHALGLWGHSNEPTDALYPQQVREPPPLSARDINTLIRLYQQPTRLGWPLPSKPSP